MGFELVDLLQGILMIVKQLENGEYKLENQYVCMVCLEGNFYVIKILEEVFDIIDWMWWGIGVIFGSGYEFKVKYVVYDVCLKFDVNILEVLESDSCIVGEVMKGIKKLFECFNFGKVCKLEILLGVFMVSLEGVCVVYYYFFGMLEEFEIV